jgi:hypothetical protein
MMAGSEIGIHARSRQAQFRIDDDEEGQRGCQRRSVFGGVEARRQCVPRFACSPVC